MSLEQYKTQVLLLHSEQNTLDTLSAGFNDRYSVHCATSGTEALNTLGDTPIHVFVSAQELPGMSGLDAIREARKRSPKTIGILLAGINKQDGLEALVGIDEVYRIVRGKIEPEELLELIESATNESSTKSMRLLALSESANDHKADVDEPVSEHIVMETSENGSTIISDGTGRMPVLRPSKISIAPGAGGREVDVLVLTKDEEFLGTIKDSARGLHNVYHALTPTQAEDIARDNKVGVLVTDAAMVGANIEGLTQRLRAKRARIVAIVAGRRDDGELLMDLINRGHVYRFLLKPVSPGRARLAIEASVKHHMEAPDEAFKPKSKPAQTVPTLKTAPAPAPQAKAKPVAKPTPKPTTKPEPRNAPQARSSKPASKPGPGNAPQARTSKPASKPEPRKKIEPTISAGRIEPTIDPDLDTVFSGTGNFTDTMTDIAAYVGKSLSDAKGSVAENAKGLVDSVGTMRSSLPNNKMLAIGGGAVAIVAVVAWLLMGRGPAPDDVPGEVVVDTATAADEPTTRVPAPDTAQPLALPAAGETAVPSPAPPYAALLKKARAARDGGNLIAPAGESAIELYVATIAEAGDDPIVVAEFNEVVGQVLGVAENAILAKNTDDAKSALEIARMADPRNPRLTFLDAQLSELQLRDTAALARVAIREERFQDAEALISEAEGLSSESSSVEIELLTDELQAARIQQQVGQAIALANERLDAGMLISPASDSARFYFQQAQLSDPENQAAQQGLIAVASKLVLRARAAIDDGQLNNADTLLGDAATLDPNSSELSAATTALADAREAIAEAARKAEAERLAEQARQQEAARVAEAERLAELQRQQEAARVAEAERLAELQRQQEAARVAEAERLAEQARQEEAARQAEIQRKADLERQAEEQRQAELRREAEAKQQEADRIAARQREAAAAAAALEEAEKNANKTATASPLGVGAAAPKRQPAPVTNNRTQASDNPTPVPEKPKPEMPASNGATTFGLAELDTAVSTGAQQAPAVMPHVQPPAPQQFTPVQARAQTTTNASATSDGVTNKRPAEPELVAVSSLTRTNYVGPEYPRAARRRNITGSVDVMFTVTTDGRVRNMSIAQSEPGDTFDQAAMDAVEQWRFEPVIENGVAVEKRTAVRLAFDLQ